MSVYEAIAVIIATVSVVLIISFVGATAYSNHRRTLMIKEVHDLIGELSTAVEQSSIDGKFQEKAFRQMLELMEIRIKAAIERTGHSASEFSFHANMQNDHSKSSSVGDHAGIDTFQTGENARNERKT